MTGSYINFLLYKILFGTERKYLDYILYIKQITDNYYDIHGYIQQMQ